MTSMSTNSSSCCSLDALDISSDDEPTSNSRTANNEGVASVAIDFAAAHDELAMEMSMGNGDVDDQVVALKDNEIGLCVDDFADLEGSLKSRLSRNQRV